MTDPLSKERIERVIAERDRLLAVVEAAEAVAEAAEAFRGQVDGYWETVSSENLERALDAWKAAR